MSGATLRTNGRKKFKLGPFPEAAGIIRNIKITPQILDDLCVEEIKIGRKVIFTGTMLVANLVLPAGAVNARKFYFGAVLKAGTIAYVTLRSFGVIEQHVRIVMRVETPLGVKPAPEFEMNEP